MGNVAFKRDAMKSFFKTSLLYGENRMERAGELYVTSKLSSHF